MTVTDNAVATPRAGDVKVRRIWAELTRNCQLSCIHCYAESGPSGSHGNMTIDDWLNVVDDADRMGAFMIQFIGGEPTMHPHFPAILRHAISTGIEVEVYTNLVHITGELWELLTSPRVSLAFSYYSNDAVQHNKVTMRNSHAATRRNAAKAVSLGIPIRAGVIDTGAGQVDRAKEDLHALGITKIGVDRIRSVGRGGINDITELCGRCGQGVAAISPDGDVWPCIFARWLPIGNVLKNSLADILASGAMSRAIAAIPNAHRACEPDDDCSPGYPPSSCQPRT